MQITKFPKKIFSFFKEVKLEMKKVNWPSKREVFKNTLIVLGVSLALAVFLGGLDFLFSILLNKLIS
jgi:preprotein translocase subunit SecE